MMHGFQGLGLHTDGRHLADRGVGGVVAHDDVLELRLRRLHVAEGKGGWRIGPRPVTKGLRLGLRVKP